MIDERDRQAEYEYLRYRRRRLRQFVGGVVLAALAVALIVLAALDELPAVDLSPKPPTARPENALFVNAGLSRATLTRTKVVAYDASPQGQDGNATPTPDVVSALLEADLQDPKSEDQLPAAAVQVSASPIGRGRLQLSAVVDAEVGPASGGTFLGTIQVFSGNQVVDTPLVVYLAPRDGSRAALAVFLLLIGAVLGLAVKWITESLTRLAAARWRLDDLRRNIGGDRDALPLMATARLEEIEDRIRRQDTENLDEAFGPVVSNLVDLRSFAASIRAAEDEIREQRRLAQDLDEEEATGVVGLDRDFAESIVRAETTRIERLRAVDWPWSDGDKTVADLRELADQCRTATLALSDALNGRSNDATFHVLDFFRKGNFSEAVELYRLPPSELPEAKAPQLVERKPRPSGRSRFWAEPDFVFQRFPGARSAGLVPWMAQRPRWFAGAASVFVVSLVGLQLQYLDANGFTGELGDWLGLLLWAAVVELSGVSVLDVLSRLGGTAPSAGGGPRVGSPTSADASR